MVRPSVRGHSNSVIFDQISSKFHIWIAFINFSFKFEYGFCLTFDNQDGRHLSISTVVVTLTRSFLMGFLQNFIYRLLPSTFCSSLNVGFVRHPIIKIADKMAATYQYPPLWSLSVIFNLISSKFYTRIASINLSFMFKYGFCPTSDNQDGDKMAATYQYLLLWSL